MSNPGYGAFQIGTTPYPLTASTSNSLLQDADPPLYWLLDYFASELNTYAGSRWTNEIARAGLTSVIPNIVGMTFPNNPTPYLQDTGATFPILAVYRVEGNIKEKSISYVQVESNLEIMWILPPLTMGQMEIVGPFFNVVCQIMQDRSEYGADPNYLDGYVWGAAAGFDWLQMTEYHRMLIQGNKLPMESLVMQLKMRERNMPVPNAFPQITEVNTELDLINQPTDTPPTIFTNFIDIQQG